MIPAINAAQFKLPVEDNVTQRVMSRAGGNLKLLQ